MAAGSAIPQHLLKPETLAGLANLDLVARAVVNGFLTGMHRSPFFGFSQEFAEYRPYTLGDDLRYVDWNVFARTERCYLKRYRGETNTQLTLLLDCIDVARVERPHAWTPARQPPAEVTSEKLPPQ